MEASDLAPSVIFFDEVDALAQIRSGEEANRSQAQFVNQFLTLMDGMYEYERVCVLGSTNRIELIDPAILRPGRFDYQLKIDTPTVQGCQKILEVHTSKMPVEEGFDVLGFAEQLIGLSGADIAHVTREAAYNALRRTFDLRQLILTDETADGAWVTVKRDDFNLALARVKARYD